MATPKKANLAVEQAMEELAHEELESSHGATNSHPILNELDFGSNNLQESLDKEGGKKNIAKNPKKLSLVTGKSPAHTSAKGLDLKNQDANPPLSDFPDSVICFEPNKKNKKTKKNKAQPIKNLADQNLADQNLADQKPANQNGAKSKWLAGTMGQAGPSSMAMAGVQSSALNWSEYLRQSEYLREAQEKIVALDEEIERLRRENEELLSTADHFEKSAEKRQTKYIRLKRDYEESREDYKKEKKVLMDTLSARGREIEHLKLQTKSLEDRLSNNIQQIRVRERELEHRLDIVTREDQVIRRAKERDILDLRRLVDQLKMDLNRQKDKYNVVQKELEEFREGSRKAVRSLNVSLNILRGGVLANHDSHDDFQSGTSSSAPSDEAQNEAQETPSPLSLGEGANEEVSEQEKLKPSEE